MPAWQSVLRLVRNIGLAAVGGTLATLAGIPASWLTGGMIAVGIASLAGLNTRLPLRLLEVVMLMIGITLGNGITPGFLSEIGSWPLSLAGLAVSVVLCQISVQVFLRRVAGWDRATAFFAGIPGALSYVLILASESRADLGKVAIAQSIRLFLLVALLPSLVLAIEPAPVAAAIVPVAPPAGIVLLLLSGAAAGLLFRALRVPAAMLSGSLAASGLLHGMGWVEGGLPGPLIVAVYVVLGTFVGSRFSGITLAALRRLALASLGAFTVALAVASAAGFAVAELTGEPVSQVLIAFAPGGLDAMTALAVALRMDTAYVAVHQLARFAGIALIAPIVTRFSFRNGAGAV
jgi:membrane AbrB-like protein